MKEVVGGILLAAALAGVGEVLPEVMRYEFFRSCSR